MTCPACQSPRVFPSRLRNGYERLRQRLTEKQPYRCHECNWRRWRDVQVHPDAADVHPGDLRTGRPTAPVSAQEFDLLDTQPTKPR
jgi:hypothetical protein